MRKIPLYIMIAFMVAGCSSPSSVPVQKVQPKVLYREAPVYPHELHQAGVQGTAVVEFIVSSEGLVVATQVVKADHPLFGYAAAHAIRQWRFIPGQVGDRLVNTRMRVPVYFKIDDPSLVPGPVPVPAEH